MARKCGSRIWRASGPTWYCVRCHSMADGTTSAIRANTLPLAGMKPRHTWKKSKPWSAERSRFMNPKLLATRWAQLPEEVVVELQAEKLRHYLRTVVLPFSPHYRELFAQHGLKAESIRTLEDLEQIPFTSKNDLLNTPDNPQRARDFLIIPDQQTLARRPSTVLRALCLGRERVKSGFEAEFRPIFLTSTTGRS